MVKFKVLKNNQVLLNGIGIFLDHSSNSNKIILAFLSCYVPIIQIIGLIITAAPIFIHFDDIVIVLGAAKISIAIIQCVPTFFGVKQKVIVAKTLQNELQRIINTGK